MVSSAAERRLFVRESAARLAAVASVTVKPETAPGLAEACRELAVRGKAVGAERIAGILETIASLCDRVVPDVPASFPGEADELVKAAFSSVQSTLFTMALGGSLDAPDRHFAAIESRVWNLIGEPEGRTAQPPPAPEPARSREPGIIATPPPPPEPPAPPLSLVAAPAPTPAPAPAAVPAPAPRAQEPAQAAAHWDELSSMISGIIAVGPGGGQADGRFGSHPEGMTEEREPVARLLRSIHGLAQKIMKTTGGLDPELADASLRVVEDARSAHSRPFADVCQGLFETDTPASLVEAPEAARLGAWLREWRAIAPPTAVASLRSLGPLAVAEIRSREPFAGGAEARRTADGWWATSLEIPLRLTSFRALTATAAGRRFLLPAEEVVGTRDAAATSAEAIGLAPLLGLRDPAGGTGASFQVRHRGRTFWIECSALSGPDTVWTRLIEAAGPGVAGIVGTARLGDSSRAAVLDLGRLLESWIAAGSRLSDDGRTRTDVAPAGKYAVFRASGRRYAIPIASVKGVGRVDSGDWLTGTVEHERGAFHLRDAKAALGLEGESGGVYIILQASWGACAWAVDGIEKVWVADAPMPLLGPPRPLHRGTLPGGAPGAPVYLIDVERLGAEPAHPGGRHAA